MSAINEQIFLFLLGDWAVRRCFGGSYDGAFAGMANFAPETGAALRTHRYHEQGELCDAEGRTFHARQSYLYRLAGSKLEVLKREELEWILMHELDFDLNDGLATASHCHLCGEDHYSASYRVDFAADTWEVTYTVRGPKKDYRIDSFYTREDER